MDAPTLFLILAGFAVVAGGLMLAGRLGRRFGGPIDLDRARRYRPWWGNPGVWLLVSAAFVFLGMFVFPKLFGFTFVFLPFVWAGGLWRRRPPRNGTPRRPDTTEGSQG